MAQVFTGQTISRNGAASARTTRLVSVGPAPQVLAALEAGAGAAGTSATAGTDASLTQSTQHAGAGRLAPQPVTISAKRLTATRRGEIVIEVNCPLSATSGCRGTIAIRLAAPSSRRARAARCARGCRSLASANYEARAGQRLRVRAHMSSFGRRLLARRGRLRVTLTATSVTEGRTVQSTRTATLSR